MTELLTAEQMRDCEQRAIASGEVTGLRLMERAGRGVVNAIFAHWPALAQGQHHAVVLCGPGNNGGDGFVVARRLRDKGWAVEVLFWGDAAKLSEGARTNHDVWARMGEIQPLSATNAGSGPRPALLVDALFGTGLTRAIPREMARAFHAVAHRGARGPQQRPAPLYKVAVDCPSGMDTDSGKFLLPAPPEEGADEAANLELRRRWWENDASIRLLRADLTLAFHRSKVGHVLSDAVGKVQVVDIGLGEEDRQPSHLMQDRVRERVTALDYEPPADRTAHIWPAQIIRKSAEEGKHKYDHGHAFVLSGKSGRTGAARLAARGALRIGAGLVTLGVPPKARTEVAAQTTAVMLKRIGGCEGLMAALDDSRITALCLGPGLGITRARSLVRAALQADHAPAIVLDADALTAFSDAPDDLFALLHADCVLTPHEGEFARLFPDIAEALNAVPVEGPAFSRVDAARAAAKRAGCVVLLKGPQTVIAAADGRCSINAATADRAAPWLATAGSGDVLAGFITGLLARGVAPMQAAEAAAWLHVECARAFGPGLIAEDLPEVLPKVMRKLLGHG